MGTLYRDGPLLTPDWVNARHYFRRAAQQGLTAAQYALGKLLLSDDLEVRDPDEGLGWLRRAAQNGHSYAAYRLGKEYLKGEVVQRDVRDKIQPHLGEKEIRKVTASDIQRLYQKLKKEGRADGGSLAGATVRRIHGVLHQALSVAVDRHLIVKNPTNDVTLPKKETTPKTILNDEQLERFMEAIKQDQRWHDFFYLEITTGLRRGELCGLMWSDFDEKKGTLSIRRTLHEQEGGGYYVGDTKTGNGRRIIKLPPGTEQLLTERKRNAISQWIYPNPISPMRCRRTQRSASTRGSQKRRYRRKALSQKSQWRNLSHTSRPDADLEPAM